MRLIQIGYFAWKYGPDVKRRLCALGFAIFVHGYFIHALTAGTAHSFIPRPAEEMRVVFLNDSARETPPQIPEFTDYEIPLIPPPEVVVLLARGPNAITAQVAQPIIGPRMDPQHLNPQPELPVALKRAMSVDPVVVLKIQVLEDGKLGDIQVLQTCGASTIDDTVVAFAKANWRYLPAMRNGRPIEDWLTVAVPFRNA